MLAAPCYDDTAAFQHHIGGKLHRAIRAGRNTQDLDQRVQADNATLLAKLDRTVVQSR